MSWFCPEPGPASTLIAIECCGASKPRTTLNTIFGRKQIPPRKRSEVFGPCSKQSFRKHLINLRNKTASALRVSCAGERPEFGAPPPPWLPESTPPPLHPTRRYCARCTRSSRRGFAGASAHFRRRNARPCRRCSPGARRYSRRRPARARPSRRSSGCLITSPRRATAANCQKASSRCMSRHCARSLTTCKKTSTRRSRS